MTLPQLPVDRKTDPAPVQDPLTAGQVIEILEAALGPIRSQVRELHEVVMGLELPDGTVKGGIGQAFHDINNAILVVKGTTESLYAEFSGDDERRPLAERIAHTVANKVLASYQAELRGLREQNGALVARLSALEAEPGQTTEQAEEG